MRRPELLQHLNTTQPHSDGLRNISLPSNILETFIPGWHIMSRVLTDLLGFDINIFVSACTILFALVSAGSYVWRRASEFVSRWCMTRIVINGDDMIHKHVMNWLSMNVKSTTLIAKTKLDDGVKGHPWTSGSSSSFHLSEWTKSSCKL